MCRTVRRASWPCDPNRDGFEEKKPRNRLITMANMTSLYMFVEAKGKYDTHYMDILCCLTRGKGESVGEDRGRGEVMLEKEMKGKRLSRRGG